MVGDVKVKVARWYTDIVGLERVIQARGLLWRVGEGAIVRQVWGYR